MYVRQTELETSGSREVIVGLDFHPFENISKVNILISVS